MTNTVRASQSNSWTSPGTSTIWTDGGNRTHGVPPGALDIAELLVVAGTVTGPPPSKGALAMIGTPMACFAMDLDILGVTGQLCAMDNEDATLNLLTYLYATTGLMVFSGADATLNRRADERVGIPARASTIWTP